MLTISEDMVGGFRVDRFRDVVKAILRNPQEWYQAEWHKVNFYRRIEQAKPLYVARDFKLINGCGTAHCFAGWCDILSGYMKEKLERNINIQSYVDYFYSGFGDAEGTTMSRAIEWLCITEEEGYRLFSGANNLKDIYRQYYNIVANRLKVACYDASSDSERLLELQCCALHNLFEMGWMVEKHSRDTPVFSADGPRELLPFNEARDIYEHLFSLNSSEELEKLLPRGNFTAFAAKLELDNRSTPR